MNENKFWFSCWALVAAVLVAIPAIIAADDMYGAHQVAALIDKGAPPVSARCAIYGSSMDAKLDCNLFVAQRPTP